MCGHVMVRKTKKMLQCPKTLFLVRGWGLGTRLISPLRLALSGARHFKQPICSRAFTYQYSYSLVVHIAEDYELLHSTSTKSSRCMCSISANSRTLHRDTGRAHTSCTHFNWIFELMSSLRSLISWHNAFNQLLWSNTHLTTGWYV